MIELNGWEIAGLVVLAYALIVYLLYRLGWIGRDRSLSFFGPALMIKTRRGRDLIERVGRARRFWTVAADAGIVLAAVSMAAMIGLLLLDAAVSLTLSPSQAPSVQEALGIPGINPIIPLGYGIVALVVGVVLHELFHGFVARSQGIGVKTLGVLWFVVPVGAFVEQDDQDMEKADRRRRDRVGAAGILANFLLALLFFAVLSAVVASSVVPNANGVGIVGVFGGSPADNASLAPGDILISINHTATTTNAGLQAALATLHPHQTVALEYYSAALGHTVNGSVTPEPASVYTGLPADAGKAFLGISLSFLTPAELASNLASPWASPSGPIAGGIDWIVLPIAGLSPIAGAPALFFHIGGPFAGADPGWFWIGVNLLYWLAWMDFLLGASNALPLIPLDGGLLVRDFSASIAARFRRGWDPARLDRFGGSVAVASSLLVVLLILWQFVAPRL